MVAWAVQESRERLFPGDRSIFCVRASATPDSLSRVAGLFAQRGLLPAQLCCRHRDGILLIDIEVSGIDRLAEQQILQKLRSLTSVERASLVERG